MHCGICQERKLCINLGHSPGMTWWPGWPDDPTWWPGWPSDLDDLVTWMTWWPVDLDVRYVWHRVQCPIVVECVVYYIMPSILYKCNFTWNVRTTCNTCLTVAYVKKTTRRLRIAMPRQLCVMIVMSTSSCTSVTAAILGSWRQIFK